MSLPSDMNVLMDASNKASFKCASETAGDRGLIDTVGILTQATAASQTTFCNLNCGAGPGVIFGGTTGAPIANTPTFFSATGFAFQIPFSLTVAMRGDGTGNVFELSTNVASARGVMLGTDTAAVSINGPAGLATFTAAAGWNSGNTAQVVTLTCDGTKAGTKLFVNGAAVTLTPSGTDPGTGTATISGTVGQDHAVAAPFQGAISFLGFIPGRVQTVAETTAIQTYCATTNYFAPAGSVTYNTISIGDSLSIGALNTPGPQYGFYQRALGILGARFGASHNNGQSGATLTGPTTPIINTQWTTNGPGQLVAGKPNLVFIEGGINDITIALPTSVAAANTIGVQTPLNMATVIANVASNLAGLSGGPHYLVVSPITLSQLGNAGQYQQLARRLANDLYRANIPPLATSNMRVLLPDIGRDAVLSGYSNTISLGRTYPYYYSGEGTHPCKPGQERWAAILARAILAAGL